MESTTNLYAGDVQSSPISVDVNKISDVRDISNPSTSSSLTQGMETKRSPSKSVEDRGVINPNFVSWVSLQWLDKFMLLGYKRPLEIEDLPLLNPKDQTAVLSQLIVPYWDKLRLHLKDPKHVKQPHLFSFVFRQFFGIWFFGFLCFGVAIGSQLTVPTFIQQIIFYLQPTYPKENLLIRSGVGIAFVLLGLQLVYTLFGQTTAQIIRTITVNLKTVLIGAVYEKSLRLSNEAGQKFTQGNILNLIHVDTVAIADFLVESHMVIVTPIQVAVTLYLLYTLLGSAIWAALGALFASLLLQGCVFSFIGGVHKNLLSSSDARLKLVREMLYAIQVIKFRAWEPIFETRVGNLRNQQLKALRSFNTIMVLFICLAQLTPILMPIAAFIAYVRNSPETGLDPAVIFPALGLFQILISPMFVLPTVFSNLIRAIVSWNRLSAFLRASESEPIFVNTQADPKSSEDESSAAIQVANGTFRWERVENKEMKDKGKGPIDKNKGGKDVVSDVAVEDSVDTPEAKTKPFYGKKPAPTVLPPLEPFIKDLTLSIPRGKLTFVVGPVGSGKSSLLNAMIGEMTRLEGSVTFHGRIAYVPQQPWILTDTVEGNVIFGSSRAVDSERLAEAVRVTALGPDLERLPFGIKTQIGEKGVNISGGQKARVSLARAVYDDADIFLLDDPISALDAHVGQTVFQNCILGALNDKTRVLVTHQLHLLPQADIVIVMDNGCVAEMGTYQSLIATEGSPANTSEDGTTSKGHKQDLSANGKEDEKKNGGRDAANVVNSDEEDKLFEDEDRTKGTLKKQVWLSFYNAAGGTVMVVGIIVAAVLQQSLGLTTSLWLAWWSNHLPYYYGILGGSQAVTMIFLNGLVVLGGFLASVHYHKAVMKRLLRAPISFFESQPIGRILNRFSKDIESLDHEIWMFFFFVVFSTGSLLASTSLIAYVAPYLLLLIGPLLVVYYFILRFYRTTIREVKRLDSNERSPLYAHISETLSGVPSIRAFRVEEQFIAKQRRLLDLSNSPSLYSYSIIAGLIIFSLGLLGVTSAINPALIGLSLSYALNIVEDIGFLLKSIANLESEMNAVERLDTYATSLPQEALSNFLPTQRRTIGLKLDVLILNLEINPGEKIGVVGRTGSGKSTLLTTLFRLVEPHSGTIEIDGQNIEKLGLSLLRSSIGIITQEPVLFSGTIRSNLDVEGLYQDNEIWDVLEMIGMKTYVSLLFGKLDDPVSENGENLSVGQRQLICLGRAILYRSRILLLDEATASVDQAADTLIQQSIQTHFKSATVISIAHRLNTVVGLDRVLVLQDGEKVEFDAPGKLLNDENSAFWRLAQVTGEENLQLLKVIAAQKEM
ncbi:P-loop containing nucleoside triphosphate hydrolase protein [Chytridium lagenaria]|nr:P-loop containing nucleoside triphosphate hydrolase protein [Chytridium lagenaria]